MATLARGRPLAAFLLGVGLPLGARPPLPAPPDLVVEARLPEEPTGTMHFAESLTLRIGDAAPLVLGDGFQPIPGPRFRLTQSRFLLLGWSSTGGGMQTLHAITLGVEARTVVLDATLALTTDRPSSVLLVHPEGDGRLRIGIPEPPFDTLHDPEEWGLRTGPGDGEALELDGLLDLPFEEAGRGDEDELFSPPFGKGARPARVAWVRVEPSGRLVLPPRGRTPDSLLRRLYAAHRPWAGESLLPEGAAPGETTLARFLDEPLLAGLRRHAGCRDRARGVGLIDFDPFLDAQDFDDAGPSGLSFRCATAGDGATCAVSFQLLRDDPASRRALTFRLRMAPGGWRVRDVDWGREESFAALLSLPCR